jgi:hypothetical protein
VQAQPPLEPAADSPEAGELKTESCFSSVLLWHFGQAIFSDAERTIVSKRWLHLRQQYSKIGICPRFSSESQISDRA